MSEATIRRTRSGPAPGQPESERGPVIDVTDAVLAAEPARRSRAWQMGWVTARVACITVAYAIGVVLIVVALRWWDTWLPVGAIVFAVWTAHWAVHRHHRDRRRDAERV